MATKTICPMEPRTPDSHEASKHTKSPSLEFQALGDLLVGMMGVESICDQLLFLLLIRERRYIPMKGGRAMDYRDGVLI